MDGRLSSGCIGGFVLTCHFHQVADALFKDGRRWNRGQLGTQQAGTLSRVAELRGEGSIHLGGRNRPFDLGSTCRSQKGKPATQTRVLVFVVVLIVASLDSVKLMLIFTSMMVSTNW